MRKLSRKAVAFTIAATCAVPLIGVMATPASASAPPGLYFCYYEETITVGSSNVPYVVPASITTQPYTCPPGSIAVRIV